MIPLEQKILDLLPVLSDEAKNKARLILGTKPPKRKKKQVLTNEEARLIVSKLLKKINFITKQKRAKPLQHHPS